MTVRFATTEEIAQWNNLILTNPDGSNLFQTKEFADIKGNNNWTPLFIKIDELAVLVLQRKVPAIGNFWYIPKGPGIMSVSQLEGLLPNFKKFTQSHGVFAIKLEPELLETPETIAKLTKLGLQKSKAVQAANTIVVDISKPLDDIVAGFTSKTRGNIRAAQKAGVTTKIVPIDNQNCRQFYKLMTATIAGRSHVRSYEYFKNFWQTHYRAGTGIFVFAESDGEVQAMDFIILFGDKATRKEAASSRQHTVRGASALLELEVIKLLKDRGINIYDLYGSPPSHRIKDPTHPFYGFGTFKAGFNPEVTDYVGCYDLVIKPLAYKTWQKIGERVAHRIHRQKYKDLYY